MEGILVLVLLAFSAVSASSIGNVGDDKCDPKILDDAGRQIVFFTNRNFTYPTNSQEMKKTCKNWEKSIDNIKSYGAECLDPLQRQVLRLILYGASKTINSMCTEKGTKEALQLFPCISKHKERLWDCTNLVVTNLEAIVSTYEGVDRIVPTCCTFQDYSTCAYETMLELCDQDTANYVKRLEDGYTADLWDLACVVFDVNKDKCLATKVQSTGDIIENSLSSLLPPLIQVFLDVSD